MTALRVITHESERVGKLQQYLESAQSGDPFWVASRDTLNDQLKASQKVLNDAEVEAQALRDLLRAKGEVPNG